MAEQAAPGPGDNDDTMFANVSSTSRRPPLATLSPSRVHTRLLSNQDAYRVVLSFFICSPSGSGLRDCGGEAKSPHFSGVWGGFSAETENCRLLGQFWKRVKFSRPPLLLGGLRGCGRAAPKGHIFLAILGWGFLPKPTFLGAIEFSNESFVPCLSDERFCSAASSLPCGGLRNCGEQPKAQIFRGFGGCSDNENRRLGGGGGGDLGGELV
jgi:hypothetical protein